MDDVFKSNSSLDGLTRLGSTHRRRPDLTLGVGDKNPYIPATGLSSRTMAMC